MQRELANSGLSPEEILAKTMLLQKAMQGEVQEVEKRTSLAIFWLLYTRIIYTPNNKLVVQLINRLTQPEINPDQLYNNGSVVLFSTAWRGDRLTDGKPMSREEGKIWAVQDNFHFTA